MRALVVTNMYPSPEHPALGSFVRDQVVALQQIPAVELELFSFDPGGVGAYRRAAAELRRRFEAQPFDVVHAHFGLTAWPAFAVSARRRVVTMHGTDLVHPRSRLITLSALPFIDLPATVSEPLASRLPRWASRRGAVLPCGVAMDRFKPMPRAHAREVLGLDPAAPCLLFPASPARAEKRYDLAAAVAGEVPLLTVGDISPEEMPLWVNAANAVIVPSDRESFGLAVLEALACDVPVLATPVGIAPQVLDGVDGAYCGPFELGRWREALHPHLAAQDPRIEGRVRAEPFSSDRMAARVLAAWQQLLGAKSRPRAATFAARIR